METLMNVFVGFIGALWMSILVDRYGYRTALITWTILTIIAVGIFA